MDSGARKILETVTIETLHAHNFSRSSSLATQTLTDLLARYLALLSATCAKYAEHAGRLRLNARDAVAALDELGVGVQELSDYCAVEGRDMARYAVHTASRMQDLNEFKASLAVGLREDRDDAIPLVYGRVPTPALSEDDEEASEEEDADADADAEAEIDAEMGTQETVSSTVAMDVDATRERPTRAKSPLTPPASPPRPLSPISEPSTPPRKRARTANWQPPEHIPDFLPPFPSEAAADSLPSPPLHETAQPAPTQQPNPVKLERGASPPPPLASGTSSDYLTAVPYDLSVLANAPTWHLPPAPPANPGVVSQKLPLPQTQPALLGAYHHVLTHPPPPTVTSVNPSRYRVALAFLHEAEARPRWDPAPSLFSISTSNPPRVAPVGPSYPQPTGKTPLTPPDAKEKDAAAEKKSGLPNAPPKPVVSCERITPLVSQQTSRLPQLARNVLPGSVYGRTTRLIHPPVLQRGAQKLVYGPGVSAPWNSSATPAPAPQAPAAKGKDGGTNGAVNGEQSKPLPDARMFATWNYEQKHFNEPLAVPRRNRVGSIQQGPSSMPGQARSESRIG
ncbi:hypothetical protein CERSUDRAFT_107100 [Gelatoporia subvermispora B]|uniref:Bromodomain associated domain-containing protein n=1 Tax=Ceriporiopsis subvermispora (strain B) TaxID=914234 RepID=M2PGG0_CERS8|nr:hypothetical protein CERSUDRAFT_107100 [Gelatoporia subvermispora B]